MIEHRRVRITMLASFAVRIEDRNLNGTDQPSALNALILRNSNSTL